MNIVNNIKSYFYYIFMNKKYSSSKLIKDGGCNNIYYRTENLWMKYFTDYDKTNFIVSFMIRNNGELVIDFLSKENPKYIDILMIDNNEYKVDSFELIHENRSNLLIKYMLYKIKLKNKNIIFNIEDYLKNKTKIEITIGSY